VTEQLISGSLQQALVRTTERALASGALMPIRTDQVFVEQAGVRFLVRSVSSLARKQAQRRLRGASARGPVNPFLPPEPELTVGAVSETHLAVLNKFKVLDGHLLLVTRAFEHQETLLGAEDFQALWRCLAELDGLAFYNGGEVAGASQIHKHLQLVPLPLIEGIDEVPVSPLLGRAPAADGVQRVPGVPFVHAFARLDPKTYRCPESAAQMSLGLYRAMLAAVGVTEVQRQGERRQSAPYNLLVTRRWMLMVRRSREYWRGISVNALGFAGSLFVKDRAQIEVIRCKGPLQLLAEVAVRA
jgi:ATP adenylyltransferase